MDYPLFQTWKAVVGPHYLDCFIQSEMEKALQRIQPAASKNLLDIGCSTGEKCQGFQALGYEVTGVDINEAHIECARKAFPALRFVLADAEQLPFPDNSFDVVHAFSVMQYTDHKRYFAEIHRVLKPGGVAILMENLKDNPFTRVYRALHRLAGWQYSPYQTPKRHLDWTELCHTDLSSFSKSEFEAKHLLTPFSLVPAEIKSRIVLKGGCYFPPPTWLYSILKKADHLLLRFPGMQEYCWLVSIYLQK